MSEIQQTMAAHRVSCSPTVSTRNTNASLQVKPHEYAAQIKLAKQITLLIHGGLDLQQASRIGHVHPMHL